MHFAEWPSTRAARWFRALTLSALVVVATPSEAVQNAIVGTGTAASCTNASWQAAWNIPADATQDLLITFNCGTIPLTISVNAPTEGLVRNYPTITVDGGTPGLITLSAASGRILDFPGGRNLTVKNLTFIYGVGSASNCTTQDCDSGGAVRNLGSMTVINCSFSGNAVSIAALSSATVGGGALFAGNGLTVINSTFSGNSATGGAGGAIYFQAAGARIINSTFFNNVSQKVVSAGGSSKGGYGGAISGIGGLTVSGSHFAGNSADVDGGAVKTYGSLNAQATVVVANSSFFSNSALRAGGGLHSDVFTDSHVTNSTFSGNSAVSSAGGIAMYLGTVANSIVARNTPTNCSSAGGVTDGGGNLVLGDATCPGLNANPLLVAPTLAVPYFQLGTNSPAINTGLTGICAAAQGSPNFGAGGVDQLGRTRRIGTCDVGAYESQPVSLVATAGSVQNATINTPFRTVLQAKVLDAFNNPLNGTLVAFSGPPSGAGLMGGGNALSSLGGVAYFGAIANGIAGTYTVAANAAGLPPANFGLTNTVRLNPLLDVDDNGQVNLLTDGLLVVRYLLGLRGTALTTGGIGANPGRTPEQIETYIQSLLL